MVDIKGANMIREIKFRKNIPVNKSRDPAWELSGAALSFMFLPQPSLIRAY